MVSGPSISEMLARLEERIAHNAEREAFHAGRESFHRDQRSSHAEELARLVELVVERKEPRERFGPRAIAAEVNQTFADHLRRPCTERQVSVALAWLAKSGRIVRHQKGGDQQSHDWTRISFHSTTQESDL